VSAAPPIRLHHVVDGAGPSLLLLHPVGLDLTCWDEIAWRCLRQFRVIRVDLAGHGRSPLPAPGYALADYARDVGLLLREQSSGPAAVVGSSFGGMVAQALAIEHSDLVNNLVLCGCPNEFSDEARPTIADRGAAAERGGMEAVLDATLQRWFTPSFIASGATRPVRQRLLSNDPRGWATAWRAISRLNTTKGLRQLKLATCCIAGELDVSVPPEAVRRLCSQICGGKLVVLPAAPHMMHLEQPDQFAMVVLDFLTKSDQPNI
jgi:3-oxoadipate enol-lactonase